MQTSSEKPTSTPPGQKDVSSRRGDVEKWFLLRRKTQESVQPAQ
jgi:hypothetical protein